MCMSQKQEALHNSIHWNEVIEKNEFAHTCRVSRKKLWAMSTFCYHKLRCLGGKPVLIGEISQAAWMHQWVMNRSRGGLIHAEDKSVSMHNELVSPLCCCLFVFSPHICVQLLNLPWHIQTLIAVCIGLKCGRPTFFFHQIRERERGFELGGYEAPLLSCCASHPRRFGMGSPGLLDDHPLRLLAAAEEAQLPRCSPHQLQRKPPVGDFPLLPPRLVPCAACWIAARLVGRPLFILQSRNNVPLGLLLTIMQIDAICFQIPLFLIQFLLIQWN